MIQDPALALHGAEGETCDVVFSRLFSLFQPGTGGCGFATTTNKPPI